MLLLLVVWQFKIQSGRENIEFEFENINTERQIYLMYHKDRIMTLPVTSVIKSIEAAMSEDFRLILEPYYFL